MVREQTDRRILRDLVQNPGCEGVYFVVELFNSQSAREGINKKSDDFGGDFRGILEDMLPLVARFVAQFKAEEPEWPRAESKDDGSVRIS
jgi:hypothetical protein